MADEPKRKPPTGRPFPKGKSGCPGGGGTGSRNRASVLLDRMADAEAEAVFQSVLAAAKRGDMGAAKLLLDRIWPQRRGRAMPIPLSPVRTVADIPIALSEVMAAVADGTLSAEEAQGLAGVLETQRRSFETVEIEARIAALEAGRDA